MWVEAVWGFGFFGIWSFGWFDLLSKRLHLGGCLGDYRWVLLHGLDLGWLCLLPCAGRRQRIPFLWTVLVRVLVLLCSVSCGGGVW